MVKASKAKAATAGTKSTALAGSFQRKPKNARAKRALKERESKVIEGDRAALFMRGTHTSEAITELLKDLHDLKKPNSTYFARRNDKRPFEDETSVEFLCQKNEASFFGFASHSKKRPNNLVLGRIFNYKIFDMHEVALTNIRPSASFKPSKAASNQNRPVMIFQGDAFESDAKLSELKSLFLDMFQHASPGKVNLAGVEHAVVLTAKGDKVSFRHYIVHLKKSGERVPKVQLEETGPSFDMEVRRQQAASAEVAREAMKVSRQQQRGGKLGKNLERNAMGDTTGRVHMQRQSQAL
eukprot:CAMPEP_0169446224 /NCGR_PEP_ID=MMETSP1042-20121227/10861_1 /TAXON_ID=464988 /ORGANISM="Hemiselmis andersenii, Strain CCMP1180" /LENGTH=295 /DNA_ID=CAMNT_0009557677 /DNA_START=901 /DNA_END=1784 /DNA_ORIENTATION=-